MRVSCNIAGNIAATALLVIRLPYICHTLLNASHIIHLTVMFGGSSYYHHLPHNSLLNDIYYQKTLTFNLKN